MCLRLAHSEISKAVRKLVSGDRALAECVCGGWILPAGSGGVFWTSRDCGVFADEWRGCEDGGTQRAEGDGAARGGGAPRCGDVKMLLEAGADPNARQRERVVPLACRRIETGTPRWLNCC